MYLKIRWILISFAFILGCTKTPKSKTLINQLVPANTVWLAEINDWEELLVEKRNSRSAQLISQFKALENFESHWQNTIQAFDADSLNAVLQQSDLFLAQVLAGADRYNWLLILLNNDPSAERLFSHFLKAENHQKINYSGSLIIKLNLSNEQELYVHHEEDYYLISSDQISLEAAIRQKASAALLPEMESLMKLRETRNKDAAANVYLQLNKAEAYLATGIYTDLSFIANMGDWLSLDLEAEKHDLIATGLLNHPLSKAYFSQALGELRTDAIGAEKLIPLNLSRWVHASVGNIGQYQRAYEAYLEKAGKLEDYNEIVAKLPVGSTSKFNGIIDNEMGVFTSGRAQGNAYHFAYFNFRDLDLCEKTMSALADSNFIEGYRGYVIRKVAALNLLPRLYGSLFDPFHQPFYLIHDDYVLLGNSLPALKVVLNNILDNKTLDRSESYKHLQNQLPGEAQIQVLFGIPDWISNQKNQLSKSLVNEMEEIQDSLQNLRWGIFQLKSGVERSLISAMLREEKPIEEKIVRQWSVQLEGQPSGEPQFLRNHINQKLDIAIQDENHHLYLISRRGEQYWNIALDGPIIGDIRQIDIYKNNKLQMVFNTKNKLWVIDRLGRNVEGFPINLEAESTAPLGVFNYDQARNYRLVVPCGTKLYNYSVTGLPVKGWNFTEASSEIISEPQFFSVAGKDIIVCLSADGKLFQLNRRGEERYKVETKIEELKTSFYLKAGKTLKESELIAGSNSGKMYVINPKGKVDAIYLDESHPADHLIYFDDRYIFTDGTDLFVKDDRRPFTAELNNDISVKPKAMLLNSRFYVAAFSAAAEEIRLFNEEGLLVDGFPVFAQGPFDMGSLNRDKNLNIVTYSSDGTLICYRLR
jgi:hypothetical protein